MSSPFVSPLQSSLPTTAMVPQVPSSPAPQTPSTQSPQSPVTAVQEAIGQFESQGNYNAIGKQTANGDRAYGKYQVMGSNIPSWTKAALGTSMTPQQFLQDPQAQNAVASYQMSKLYTQYGNPADVASAWFSGKPLAQAGNESDVNGTTVPAYVEAIMKLMGGGVASAATLPQSSASSQPSATPQPAQTSQSSTSSYPGMPPVAQFSLPTPGQAPAAQQAPAQSNQSPQAGGEMPPVAQFSLPQSSTDQSQGQPGSEGFVDPGSPASQVANPNNNPMNAATSLTNALGLGGTVNTFGGDLAHNLIDSSVPQPSAEQNIGAIAQTGAIAATPFIGPESLLGNIGAGAGLGAAQMGGQAMTENAPSQDVVQQAGIGGLLGGAASGVASGAAGLFDKLATKSVSTAIRPTAADFDDGYDAQFAVDNGMTGNSQQIAQKAQDYIKAQTAQLKTALGNDDKGIDLTKVYDKTAAELTSEEGGDKNFLQNKPVKSALATLQDEVLERNPTGNISLPRANLIKQTTGMYGEWTRGAPDKDANAMSTVANTFYRNLKEEIENTEPTGVVADINAKIQKAIPIARAAIRRIPVEERNGMGLGDMLAVLSAPYNPVGAAFVAGNHLMKSGLASRVLPPISGALRSAAPALGLAASGGSGLLGGLGYQSSSQQ